MLRNKKDSLKDISKEVRHSLQFFDDLLDEFDDDKGESPAPTPALRNMKKVPADARRSLQILDNVLGEFDLGDEEPRHRELTDTFKIPGINVTEEVQKSIEILDTVLDQFQKEGGKKILHSKANSHRNETLQRSRHEDVRRSLDVLDSVLAEFDDCLESWDSTVHDVRPPEISWIKKDREINADSHSSISYDSQTTDGSTSHDSGLSLQEQIKVTSPPPVPKRSATTKLSDRNSGLFNFSDLHSFDSLSSDSAFQDSGTNLSTNDAITALSAKEDDEVFNCKKDNNAKVDFCAKCGSEIGLREPAMEKRYERDETSSPFLERRKMFEDRIGESKRINVSPLLERSFTGSSFKGRFNRTKECESEPSSLIFYKSSDIDRSEICHSNNFASKYSPKATKVEPPRVDGLLSLPSNPRHAPNCNCKERLRQLQIKFAETRRLFKANKIKGIDAKPPSFVPPPPPEVLAKNSQNISLSSDKQLSNELSDNAGISDSNSYSASNGSLNSESLGSEISEVSHSSPVPESETSSMKNISDKEKLCNRCLSTEPTPISETIEDIPKLRPTDALKRPHFGFSLCMEEDFSPGVKEILQTSAPKIGLSKHNKLTSLSSFSLSDSSLGYVSSQSDLEISNTSFKGEKVPVPNIKCSTLPQGMDLHSLPSYYGHDHPEKDRKSNQPLYRDRNFNHTTDPQLRKSSNPLMPEAPEKPKKKHFRGFSRKDKDKKKNAELNIELTGRREIC